MDQVVAPAQRPTSQSGERAQNESRVLTKISCFSTTVPLKRHAKDIDSINLLLPKIGGGLLKAKELDRPAFSGKSLGRAKGPRIGRIIGKEKNGRSFAPETPPVFQESWTPALAIGQRARAESIAIPRGRRNLRDWASI